jgi:hypothetical protein
MNIEKFRAMIAQPERTKPELKQILENVEKLDPERGAEVKAILYKRFPSWANLTGRKAKKAV